MFPTGAAQGPSGLNVKKVVFYYPLPDHANCALRVLLIQFVPYDPLGLQEKGGVFGPIEVSEVFHSLTYVSWAVQAGAIRVLSPRLVVLGMPVCCEHCS